MKFVFVINTITIGGAERVISIITKKLVEKGHDVELFIYQHGKTEYLIDKRVKIKFLDDEMVNSNYSIVRILRRVKILRNYIKSSEANYVIPFLPIIVIETFFATCFTGKKFIATIRANPRLSPNQAIKRYMRNFVVALSSAIWVQTRSQFMYFPEIIRKKIFILPNPVEEAILNLRIENKEELVNFVTVGRLTKAKNHILLINAFHKVYLTHPNIRLLIYGDGELKDVLDKHITNINLKGIIMCKGRTNSVGEALISSDIFVLSSNQEGMPNALMEAMAVGLPCISTDCQSGPSDLIENGVNGLLVPVNDVDKLAEAMLYMINNKKRAQDMGRNSSNFIRSHFVPDDIVDKLIQICSNMK